MLVETSAIFKRYAIQLGILVSAIVFFASCSFLEKRSFQSSTPRGASNRLIGESIGEKADGPSEALLSELRIISTDKAPAALRADPDTYVRQLLREYRPEDATIAKEIGRVEKFRLLLGGASPDFKTPPSKTFDATSLLASQKVADELCKGLVAPNSTNQPGWDSILPESPARVTANIRFLAQRFLGQPSFEISDDLIDSLRLLMDAGRGTGGYEFKDYVVVCIALSLDADALLF